MKIRWTYDKSVRKKISKSKKKALNAERLFNVYQEINLTKTNIHMAASISIEIHVMNVVFYALYVELKSILIYGLHLTFISYRLMMECVLFSYLFFI